MHELARAQSVGFVDAPVSGGQAGAENGVLSIMCGGDAVEFSELAKKKNLLVVPGTSFGCKEYFRICYCVSNDMIRRSLPAFKELIDEINA